MELATKINGGIAPMDEAIIERVIAIGDLKQLKPEERNNYYLAICRSLGLNPLTRPLEYITLSGKLVLYARKDCTEQMRKLHGVSISRLETNERDGVFEAMAYAKMKDREDVDFGATSIKGLSGDALVNAKLKAITKAKRRVTLSICGLGFLDETEIELDETEIETIPSATPAPVAIEAGEPVAGLITRDQRKDMNDWIGKLKVKFGLTNEILKAKMLDATGVEHSSELTEEQANDMIGVYMTWLNQLEEAAADNARTAEQKGSVPF
jgi:hypothetical protein